MKIIPNWIHEKKELWRNYYHRKRKKYCKKREQNWKEKKDSKEKEEKMTKGNISKKEWKYDTKNLKERKNK